jgi:serine/threonine protein kinase
VYEHAANGSLADFLTNNVSRTLLTSDIRFSIMFQLTRAVHFLHAGGCKVAGEGWKVFHRDIKSDNICLAEDFTPRLIDCGLAKFVQDEDSDVTPEPLTVSLQSNTGALAFGTPGYLCPEYLRKKGRGLPCPFIAAYDVYSIGVVLVELILGCLNAVPVMGNDTQVHDLFEIYVKDRRDQRIVDGWAKLKRDADPTIKWNPDALELMCKTAIKCMAPLPEERFSTKDLLDQLRGAGNQRPKAASAVESGPRCDICSNYRTEVKCSIGHALCTTCILDKLGDYSGSHFSCLIKGCASQPFQLEDLYGRIPVETYNRFVEKRAER